MWCLLVCIQRRKTKGIARSQQPEGLRESEPAFSFSVVYYDYYCGDLGKGIEAGLWFPVVPVGFFVSGSGAEAVSGGTKAASGAPAHSVPASHGSPRSAAANADERRLSALSTFWSDKK